MSNGRFSKSTSLSNPTASFDTKNYLWIPSYSHSLSHIIPPLIPVRGISELIISRISGPKSWSLTEWGVMVPLMDGSSSGHQVLMQSCSWKASQNQLNHIKGPIHNEIRVTTPHEILDRTGQKARRAGSEGRDRTEKQERTQISQHEIELLTTQIISQNKCLLKPFQLKQFS
jgi:hypothetical protein